MADKKVALRRLLQKQLKGQYLKSPKMGFGIPIRIGFEGELKTWANDMLSVKKMERHGFFKGEMVRQMWAEHLSGKKNWQHQLWNFIVFQQWYETYIEGA